MIKANTLMTVTELNQLISSTMKAEPRLRMVHLSAEISGFKNHFASGHWYFSLKDSESSIPCCMYRQNNLRVSFKPQDGDSVTATGYIDLYQRDGRLQLYVTTMKSAGVGDLYEQFESLKQKLYAEGLFDPGRKKILPQVPRKVAVITSSSGAALHDILNVSRLRSPEIPIVIIPSSVQGDQAASELVAALHEAEQLENIDVIILARGGGAVEDLWCFNDEQLARAVAACPVAVVSGVGHEVDQTIIDFVADVRASTPSNAAEIVFPDRKELLSRINLVKSALSHAVNEKIQQMLIYIHDEQKSLLKLNPEEKIHQLLDETHQSTHRLYQVMSAVLQFRREELQACSYRMNSAMDVLLSRQSAQLETLSGRLQAVSPLKVLDRGYAIVYDENGRMVYSADKAVAALKMHIRFRDGLVTVTRKDDD